MAGPAPSIGAAAVSVQAGHRRGESQRGLQHLGVPLENQLYLEMPDGELALDGTLLADRIAAIAGRLGITNFHTLGAGGYDGHTDHIATHEATLLAAKQATGEVDILALNADHQGEHVVTGDHYQKLGAMACHVSQFALHDPQFWQEFAPYTPLIWQGETYDRLAP